MINLSDLLNFSDLLNIFFGVPHLTTFILFLFNEYVIASIAYIHPVYGGIRTHVLLDMSRESSALTTRPRLIAIEIATNLMKVETIKFN